MQIQGFWRLGMKRFKGFSRVFKGTLPLFQGCFLLIRKAISTTFWKAAEFFGNRKKISRLLRGISVISRLFQEQFSFKAFPGFQGFKGCQTPTNSTL